MRKLLLTLAVLCGTVSGWAQTSLRISEGLLATQENTQYKWTSAKLTAPTEGEFNKIRVTFLKTSNNEKPAGFPCVAIAEFYLYDKNGNAVTLTADRFSSNATQSNEGKMSAICNGAIAKQEGEGDYDWYWHSQWSGTPNPYGYHYLELNVAGLGADLSEYQIGWVTRRAQASPADVIISTGVTTAEAAKNANSKMLPEVSTEIVKLYTIKSVRSKKFLAYDKTKAKPQQINAVNNNCYWYFTQGADGKVVMHNLASGQVLGTNFEMAEAGEWYVSPAGYRPGVVFSKTGIIANNNCIDDQDNHTTIGSWHHVSGDDEGTTWFVEEVINVDVPVLSLNNLQISSIGNAVTTVEEGKWYILNNVGRGNYVSQEVNNWKMRAKEKIELGDMANKKAGYLFKITKNGDDYNIMSGNGKYFQLGSNTASTSATPVNFEIALIGGNGNNFYIFDKEHGYAADGQETNNDFVGWSKTPPTSAGGNDSYRLLPVELSGLGEIGELKDELSEAIKAAQTKYKSASIREGVNNYSAPEDFEARLETIADFCESINGRTTTDDINAKIAAAQNLKAEIRINMPENGKFYRVRCSGSGMKYLQSTLDSSNENDIRLKVLSSATSVEATFCYNEGTLVSYTTGKSINAYRYNEVGTTSNVVFSEASNGKLGTYNINVGGRYIFGANDDNKIDSGTTRDDRDGYTWWLEDVTTLPVTITSAKYATFYAPCNVTLPEGLTAYYVSDTGNGYATLTEIEGDVVPANTGVLLQGEANTYNLTVGGEATEVGGEATKVESKLSGTVASEYISTPSYVLSAQGTPAVVGFYQAKLNFTVADDGTGTKVTEGGTHFLNNGFRAYLPAGENNARSLVFDFGGTETSIDELKGENGNVKAEVYDLAGRRVLNAKKGVFVVNGKVIVK